MSGSLFIRFCLVGGWFVGLWACSEPAPAPFLTDEKVARIMADLAIAEAATTGLLSYSKDSLQAAYFNQVFQLHGISHEEYDRNMRLLAQDLPRMEACAKAAEALLAPETEKVPK